MIALTAFIVGIILMRWQVVHVHDATHKGSRYKLFDEYEVGDVINYKGYRATVIDVKTTDMVIRRHLSGLFLRAFRG